MKRAVAFIPEFRSANTFTRRLKLSDNLYLLSDSNPLALDLKKDIETLGYNLAGGSYLYYEGTLREDRTLFEIFQAYCLSLMFYYPEGHVSCRAIKELNGSDKTEIFIDEYDKFGYMDEDIIRVKRTDLQKIIHVFERVESHLGSKSFRPLSNSLEFYQLFLYENKIKTRLLYLSICLESLLLDSDKEGIAYKLSIRCAKLLKGFYKSIDANKIYTEVKNGYHLRSIIIHGSDYNKDSIKILKKKGENVTELDHILSLEKVVRAVMSLMFLHQHLYDASNSGKLGSLIDNQYILES